MRIRKNKNGKNAKILNPRKFSTAKIKVHTVYCALLSLYGIFLSLLMLSIVLVSGDVNKHHLIL